MFGIDDILIGAAITGGLSLFGSKETNKSNQNIAEENTAFNAEQAALNRTFQHDEAQIGRDFNERMVNSARDYDTTMSNTSYQRGIADLQAAGINPMLAFMKGGASTPVSPTASASVPGGSQASAAPFHPQMNAIGAAVSSAMEGIRTGSEVAKNNAVIDNTRAETIIKENVGKGTAAFGSGVDAVKSAIPAVAGTLSDVVQHVEDFIKDGSVNSAKVVEAASEIAREVADKVVGAVSAPAKVVETLTNSARKAATDFTSYSRYDKPVTAGSFTGDDKKDLRDINSIRDPVERRKARHSYDLWLFKTRGK